MVVKPMAGLKACETVARGERERLWMCKSHSVHAEPHCCFGSFCKVEELGDDLGGRAGLVPGLDVYDLAGVA